MRGIIPATAPTNEVMEYMRLLPSFTASALPPTKPLKEQRYKLFNRHNLIIGSFYHNPPSSCHGFHSLSTIFPPLSPVLASFPQALLPFPHICQQPSPLSFLSALFSSLFPQSYGVFHRLSTCTGNELLIDKSFCQQTVVTGRWHPYLKVCAWHCRPALRTFTR